MIKTYRIVKSPNGMADKLVINASEKTIGQCICIALDALSLHKRNISHCPGLYGLWEFNFIGLSAAMEMLYDAGWRVDGERAA